MRQFAGLEALRGGLIVSVQAAPGSPLDDPLVIAAIARAAQEGGAVAVRIQSALHIRAVKARCSLPVIGLIKRAYPGFEPYITATLPEVEEILGAGAEIVAFDATSRARPDASTIEAFVAAIHRGGAAAMADCAEIEDGRRAAAAGAEVFGTTLCGYTDATRGRPLPAISLVAALAKLGGFAICEGGIASPESGRAALLAGADAIVVGAAITGLVRRVGEFASALQNHAAPGRLEI